MKFLGGFVLVLSLIVLAGVGYYVYQNLPGDPIQLIENKTLGNLPDKIAYSTSSQFYENMRFPDKEISYFVEPACGSAKSKQFKEALEILEDETVLEFSETNIDPQVVVTCSNLQPDPEKKGYFIAGEGGPSEIINTSLYAVIFQGKISLFRDEKCSTPNIALHEMLHVLGFDHNDDPGSILFPTLDCAQELDRYLIEDINNLYAVEGRPDLKISEVEATKGGAYLSFKIKVVNQGLKDVEDAKLAIYSESNVVVQNNGEKFFELGDINVGSTKILTVENLKIGRNSNEVNFVVDPDNLIYELFENNNERLFVLG